MAVLKAEENTNFVLSVGRSDKLDSVLTWWSGELMSPSIGRTATFFVQTGKDISLGFVLRLQQRLWTDGCPQCGRPVFTLFLFYPLFSSRLQLSRIINLFACVNKSKQGLGSTSKMRRAMNMLRNGKSMWSGDGGIFLRIQTNKKNICIRFLFSGSKKRSVLTLY